MQANENANKKGTDENKEKINEATAETDDEETRITAVVYMAMGYMNNCWHSYFKKNGKIWCIEDCVNTFIGCSKLLNTKCVFFHIWRLYNILNDIFLDVYKEVKSNLN